MSRTTTIRLTLDVAITAGTATEHLKAALESNLDSAIQAGLLDVGPDASVEQYDARIAGSDQGDVLEVRHWNEGDRRQEGAQSRAFVSTVTDARRANGQLYQGLYLDDPERQAEGRDLVLNVTTEINSLHGNDADYPCVHVAHEDDNTLSIFRRDDGLVLRLDTGVSLQRITLPCGDPAWLVS